MPSKYRVPKQNETCREIVLFQKQRQQKHLINSSFVSIEVVFIIQRLVRV